MKKLLLVTIFALSIASMLSITCRAELFDDLSERGTSTEGCVSAPTDTLSFSDYLNEDGLATEDAAATERRVSTDDKGTRDIEDTFAEDEGASVMDGALSQSTAGAEYSVAEYVITEEDGVYVLSATANGECQRVLEGAFDTLLEFASGKKIWLDNVTLHTDITLPQGKTVLSGKILTEFSITVNTGSSLDLSEADLLLSGRGSLVISGGEVKACEVDISSTASSAVRLLSERSLFTLVSGRISSNSDTATVVAMAGRCEVLGGEIISERALAISNSANLVITGSAKISGMGYGLSTDKPITIGNGDVPYTPTEPLKMSFLGEFKKGNITLVSYINAQSSLYSIRIFDSVGREYSASYFSEYSGLSKIPFAAVYLPYSVKYYSGGVQIGSELVLQGDGVNPPEPEQKTGYAFDGWYLDSTSRVPLGENFTVTADTKLYAGYRLLPPEFSLSSYSGEYTGGKIEIGFDTLLHPLDAHGGRYEYKWYKNGSVVSEGPYLSVKSVSDSGVYSCEITYCYSTDSVVVRAEGISVIINKRSVPIPTIEKCVYNGREQSPTVYQTSLYTVSELSCTDAGIYAVTLTLTDSENYRFADGEGIVTVPFEIMKANNVWTEEISACDVYVGTEASVRARALFGEVIYLFSDSIYGEYKTEFSAKVGEYFVRAYVPADRNYNELVSEPVRFSVIDERAVSLSVVTVPDRTEYRAFELISLTGLSLKVSYNSGREEIINGENLPVIYQQADSFRYGDSAVTLEYNGASVRIPVTVKRAVYDISSVTFFDLTRTYSSLYQSVTYDGPDILGEDGIPLEISVSGGGLDVGEYTVTLSFFTDSENYETPNSIEAKLTILPYSTEISWQNVSFVYDGTPKCPVASYVDARGVIRYSRVVGSETMAGAGYTAYAISDDKNYTFVSESVAFEILKADYDMSGVFWVSEDFVYDGLQKSVSLSGLPEGVSVIGYTDAKATVCGVYVATATLSFDQRNYNAPPKQTHEWKISPASYDMTGVSFNNAIAVFDGKEHFPTLSGELPVGADGLRVEYSFSQGATHVSDGTVTVTVTFKSQSKNYISPEPMTATIAVTPRGISVSWTGESFVYNGKNQAPKATAPECKIIVSGAVADAGEYTAVAYCELSDYFVINSEYSFSILKAENAWTLPPYAKDVYESGELDVFAIAKSGEALIRYFTDPSAQNECAPPTVPGVYYAIAYAKENRNYLSLTSSPMRFEIIKVVPVSLSVELTKSTYKACSTVGEGDITASLIYNDGSERELSVSDMQIIYQDSGELRARHTKITFKHQDFSVTLPISVSLADYDTASTLWQNTVFYYDGLSKQPSLSGLPEGVTVIGYTKIDAVRAGVYTVEAILSYDAENYNPPSVPPCTFEIKKASVNIPAVATVEYDGKSHAPATSSPLYSFLSEGAYVSVGRYSFVARLSDSENYVFEDGSSECTLVYEITARNISISVSDMNVYLWDNISDANYVISKGSVVDGESLSLVQYESDGKIYLRSDNPNYKITLTPGRINSLSYPSPETSAKIVIGVIIFIAAALFVFVLYLERERIADFMAIAKFRLTSRKRRSRAGLDREKTKNVTEIFNPDILSASTLKHEARSDVSQDKFKLEKSLDSEINTEENALEAEIDTAEDDEADADTSEDNEADTVEEGYRKEATTYPTEDPEDVSPEEKFVGDTYKCSTLNEFTADKYSLVLKPEGRESEVCGMSSERADELISDALAKDLVKKGREVVYTSGTAKSIINVDTLSQSFLAGERVDVNTLKQKSLVPYDTAYLKVLARGVIDKPLSVYANDFSLAAVKMIALTGGEAVRVVTLKDKNAEQKRKF